MQNRPKVLAGNWKMNLGPIEAQEYFRALKKELGSSFHPSSDSHGVIFPPAYALGAEVQQAAASAQIRLGAQNVHWEDKGAFTGELSGTALKSLGISWVLIAHSERRQFFGETDETAKKRFAKAVSLGLNVMYCIGEVLSERESGKTEAVLTRQTLPFIEVLKTQFAAGAQPKTTGSPIWSIAYEPVWAIGTGKTATSEQAEAAHRHIRKVVWDHLGMEAAQQTPIAYGGSVTPENVEVLMSQPNVDGVLVGGASLKPEGFARILMAAPR
ncbi:MAG: triose-phosphate isomerase [Bdellovibrionota bacterium]